MAASETEEIDMAKEFNLLPVIFETIQALQRTSDPQELTKKVSVELFSVICEGYKHSKVNGPPIEHLIRIDCIQSWTFAVVHQSRTSKNWVWASKI